MDRIDVVTVHAGDPRYIRVLMRGWVDMARVHGTLTVMDNMHDGSVQKELESIPHGGRIRVVDGVPYETAMLSHGRAVDKFLHESGGAQGEGWILLLDSDTVPVVDGFDRTLLEMAVDTDILGGKAHQGWGPEWRVEACRLLFRKTVARRVLTSFIPIRRPEHAWAHDTSGAWVEDSQAAGSRIKTVTNYALESLISHFGGGSWKTFFRVHGTRWLGKRPVSAVTAGIDAREEVWFARPEVKRYL